MPYEFKHIAQYYYAMPHSFISGIGSNILTEKFVECKVIIACIIVISIFSRT